MISGARVRVLDTEPDDRLLALAREGHERAFEALVERYRERLLAHGKRLLPTARAEDAVQQALLQAWLALQRGTDVRDAKPWLYRVVHNSAIRMRRAIRDDQAPLTEAIAAPDTPQSDLERRVAARDALANLAALPELQREVVLQTAVRGRTHDQTAAALGLSNDAVRGLLYRARAKLRAAATGLIPSPLVVRAMRLYGNLPQSSEPRPGAGSAGIAAMLAKGGAVAVTVGALATAAPGAHSHLRLGDIRGAGHNQRPHAVAAQAAGPRADADRSDVDRTGSTRPAAARRTVTGAVNHVPTQPTSPTASRLPGPARAQLVHQSGTTGRGLGSTGTSAGLGVTSATHSSGSSGSATAVAASTPRRTSESDAPTSTGTGGDGQQGTAGSESSGSDSSATAPAAPTDASPVGTDEDQSSPASRGGSDSNTSAKADGDGRSFHRALSDATGAPSDGSDGSTTPQAAATAARPAPAQGPPEQDPTIRSKSPTGRTTSR